MASNVTQVMAGVAAQLETVYPAIPSRIRKGKPSDQPESFLCGWVTTDPCPAFIITCPDPDRVDEFSSFETICVKYEVTIAYVKPVLGGKAPRDDDDDIRQKRQDIRDLLEKPTLEGVGIVWGVGFKSLEPYTPSGGNSSAVTVSAEVFEFLTNEPRGFNPSS